jgi:hypothetical protein
VDGRIPAAEFEMILLPESMPPLARRLADILGGAAHRPLGPAELRQLDGARDRLDLLGLGVFIGIATALNAGASDEVLVVGLVPHDGPRCRQAVDLGRILAAQPRTAGGHALELLALDWQAWLSS